MKIHNVFDYLLVDMPLSKGRAVALSIYKAVRGLRRNKTSIYYFIRLMREMPANLVDIDKSRNLNLVDIDKLLRVVVNQALFKGATTPNKGKRTKGQFYYSC